MRRRDGPARGRSTDDARSPYYYRHGRRHDIDPIEAQAIAAVITESDNPQPVFVVDDYTRANLITAGWLACHPPEIEGDEVFGDARISLSADVQYSLGLFEPDDLPPTDRSTQPWHPY